MGAKGILHWVGLQAVTPVTPIAFSSVACKEQVWSTRLSAVLGKKHLNAKELNPV